MAGTVNLGTPAGGKVIIDATNTASDKTITAPATTGAMLVSSAVSASTTNTITNKIAVVINGTTYYLLASTSGV